MAPYLVSSALALAACSQEAPPVAPPPESGDGASAESAESIEAANVAYRQWRAWQDESGGGASEDAVAIPVEPWSALGEAAARGHPDAKLEFALLLTGVGEGFRVPEVDYARAVRLLLELTESGGPQADTAELALAALGESGEPAQRRAVAEAPPEEVPRAESAQEAEPAPNWEDRRRDIDAAEGAERIRLCAEALGEFPRRRGEIEELAGPIAAELDRVLRRELPVLPVGEATALVRAVDRLRKEGIGPISGEMVDRLERGRDLLALVKGAELPESLEDLAAVEAEIARIESSGEESFPELQQSALERLGARREELRGMRADEDLATVGVDHLLARAVDLAEEHPDRREEIASKVGARWGEIEESFGETLVSTTANPGLKDRALESLGGMIEGLRESGLDELADRAETSRADATALWHVTRSEAVVESRDEVDSLRALVRERGSRFPQLAMAASSALGKIESRLTDSNRERANVAEAGENESTPGAADSRTRAVDTPRTSGPMKPPRDLGAEIMNQSAMNGGGRSSANAAHGRSASRGSAPRRDSPFAPVDAGTGWRAEKAWKVFSAWKDKHTRGGSGKPKVTVPVREWEALETAAESGHERAKLELAILLAGRSPFVEGRREDYETAARVLRECRASPDSVVRTGAATVLSDLEESSSKAQRQAGPEPRREEAQSPPDASGGNDSRL